MPVFRPLVGTKLEPKQKTWVRCGNSLSGNQFCWHTHNPDETRPDSSLRQSMQGPRGSIQIVLPIATPPVTYSFFAPRLREESRCPTSGSQPIFTLGTRTSFGIVIVLSTPSRR